MIEELFYKYLGETMTPEEFSLFRDWATREENRPELNRLLTQWIEHDLHSPQQENIDVEKLYLELIRKEQIPASYSLRNNVQALSGRSLHAADRRSSPRRTLPRRIILLSTTIAAACLLVIAGLFLFRRPQTGLVRLAAESAPVIPATNRAILTLANGQQIVLDSAVNGQLARQGNMQVMKLAGGQLVYQAAPGTSGGKGAGDNGLQAQPMYNEIATPRGGYYQLVLPDGSKVWLNAASSLRYPTVFTGKERAVEMTGEAYFEIAVNASQPFTIRNEGVSVQVLGTAFNMMAYGDEEAIRTTLVSGSVRVSHGSDDQKIRPGQQASWTRGSNGWGLSIPDMQEVLAWKEGEFRFQGLKIAAIMRQIARWYDVDIVFRGPQPVNEFNGVIPRRKEVADLLTVLEQTDEVHFTLEGRKIIVESPLHNTIHH